MFIYKLMPTGLSPEEEASELGEQAGDVLEVKGAPKSTLAVKFTGQEEVFPAAGNGSLPQSLEQSTYWADLRGRERCKWVWEDQTQEEKREIKEVWRMFKQDPLLPFRAYMHDYGITGMGLFIEGYVVFSISNLSVLFRQSYQRCWSTFQDCNETWTQATTYLQLIGILLGQVSFGFLGDALGRKHAMLADMAITLAGIILLTCASGLTPEGWVTMYAWSQFIFGFGIGGEYPMTGTRATEESEEVRHRAQRHRGRKVMLSYTMQGWGQFINLSLLIILLLIFNSTGNPPYSHGAAGATWRVSFAVLIPLVLYVIYYRVWVLRELKVLDQAKKRDGVTGYDWRSFRLLITVFWHRLFGTAAIWFCNDWYFYGNGVFRSHFITVLLGNKASVMNNWLWSLLNAGIQLVGYYSAALTVDWKWWGRKRMTTVSFSMVAAIFLCAAAAYPELVKPSGIHWFQFLYYFSSFWALFGSHTTSFLLAAESYPTQIRGTAHGISAACGKMGAIGATVWFNYLSTRGKFWIVWPLALAGAIFTWVFVADEAGMDLAELERRWAFIRAGCAQDYHGVSVHPRHLSWWERNVLHIHRQYDPKLDLEQRRQLAARGKAFDDLPSFKNGKIELEPPSATDV